MEIYILLKAHHLPPVSPTFLHEETTANKNQTLENIPPSRGSGMVQHRLLRVLHGRVRWLFHRELVLVGTSDYRARPLHPPFNRSTLERLKISIKR
ncbi:hypothetical protein SISNIDRAFT_460336 [Sistotremastrum niveocremeum HHB9708]|nr:hypothetical protein SISNIDRAFT_460336 [Sistotremastrum niveocremeum HHB9708]